MKLNLITEKLLNITIQSINADKKNKKKIQFWEFIEKKTDSESARRGASNDTPPPQINAEKVAELIEKSVKSIIEKSTKIEMMKNEALERKITIPESTPQDEFNDTHPPTIDEGRVTESIERSIDNLVKKSINKLTNNNNNDLD